MQPLTILKCFWPRKPKEAGSSEQVPILHARDGFTPVLCTIVSVERFAEQSPLRPGCRRQGSG